MMCLGIILLRGGMELEFEGNFINYIIKKFIYYSYIYINNLIFQNKLIGKGLGVILLTTIPPLTEGIIVALLANWWLGMSISLSLCLGAVMGAVSPAVLVPCLMNL